MKSKTCTSAPAPHCLHRTPSGRFCRLPIADPGTSFCFRHALDRKQQSDAANLAAALTGDCQEFQTAVGIHASLSALYKLLAEDRVSARRAAVLAYISNLLLRTLPMALAEIQGEPSNSNSPVTIDWELPRPVDYPEVTPTLQPSHSS